MIAIGYMPEEAVEVFEEADISKEGSLNREEFELLLKWGKGKGVEDCTVVQVCRRNILIGC